MPWSPDVSTMGASLLLIAGCGRIGFDAVPERRCASDPPPAIGPTFYVGKGGSDAASGKADAPWATFAFALATVRPGDTLVILDGTYTEPLRMTRSGSAGQPIRIVAETDGGVVIDGERARDPCTFVGTAVNRISDLVIEGISCRNVVSTTAGGEAAFIIRYADRVSVRRVTATGGADAVIQASNTADLLLEDVAAWGYGTITIAINSSERATVRRCYARWTDSATTYDVAIQLTHTSDSLVENCVAEVVGPLSNQSGIAIYSDSAPTDRNRLIGNVARGTGNISFLVAGNDLDITSNRLVDNVALGVGLGLFQRGDIDLDVRRSTFVGPETGASLSPQALNELALTLTSSVFANRQIGFAVSSDPRVRGASHHHNVFWNVATPYQGTTMGAAEVTIDPGYETERYGDGAYLIRPAALATLGDSEPAGAEILYRSVDGVVTGEPLWPWPMEDRILRESGVSVTWESGGGLWRTLPDLPCR